MLKNNINRVIFIFILVISVLILAAISCTESDQIQLKKGAESAGLTVVAEAKSRIGTQAYIIKLTEIARIATQLANLTNQTTPSPWDISWLPSDSDYVIGKLNNILAGTGLDEKGEAILTNSKKFGVNPAFALAMFRKEAIFAQPNSRAYKNKNPGNIIATGNCKGLPSGSSCNGSYGEISTDGRFGVYASMDDGIKAYFTLLNHEYKPGTARNCSDIRCIITSYCPPSDCDTEAYISQIIKWTVEYQKQILMP